MTTEEKKGDLLSNCCAWDFNPMGFEKEPGIWQERCIRCGRLCEPLWISERDIKNIRRITEFEKPIPSPTPPEIGREWEDKIDWKKQVEGSMSTVFINNRDTDVLKGSTKTLIYFLERRFHIIESSALAKGEKIGAEKERERLNRAILIGIKMYTLNDMKTDYKNVETVRRVREDYLKIITDALKG